MPATTTAAKIPSAVLGPALDNLKQALVILRPEKWKAPGAVTAESATDISSIAHDLDSTLAGLLAAADAAPGSAPQLLPAYRNVDALYDVLVRVTQTAVLAAPPQQSTALQKATLSVQQARRDFGDLLDAAAQSQDRQLRDAQLRIRTLQSAPAPTPAACTPVPLVKKSKPRAKSKPSTSATAPSATPSAQTPH